MRILVHIQIPPEGVETFLAYEDKVLPLIANYGGELLARYQSENGQEEFHVLEWPSPDALDEFGKDPDRLAAQPLWQQSGATARFLTLA